jgi:hypothetical protein
LLLTHPGINVNLQYKVSLLHIISDHIRVKSFN